MTFEEKVKKHGELAVEKATLETDGKRIDDFKARAANNRDTENGMKGNLIFVKFAGTGCYLPRAIFDDYLTDRKTEIDERLVEIETEKADVEK